MNRRGFSLDYFVFDLSYEWEGPPSRLTVVFSPAATIQSTNLADALRPHFDGAIPPDRILLFGGSYARESIARIASDDAFLSTLPAITRFVDTPPVIGIVFNEIGACETVSDGVAVPEGLIDAIRQVGLKKIFFERGGILDSGDGRHYVKPSGRHSNRFIRTANVLLYNHEVAFIAANLLRWLPARTDRIYVDTASISSIAYSLIGLRSRLDPRFSVPSVDSFGSYRGLADAGMEEGPHAICLVSASTSGGLEAEIEQKHRIPRSGVITLFYCGTEAAPSSKILCDITKRGNTQGCEPILSYESDDVCPHCAAGATKIRISGDQFLPSDPRLETVLIGVKDTPSWVKRYATELVGSGVARCHHQRSGASNRTRQVYIDVTALLKPGEHFYKRLLATLALSTPAALRALVHLDDTASKAMAGLVRDFYEREVGDKDRLLGRVISADSITKNPSKSSFGDGAVMVVASTAVTGRSLLGVSQVLRRIHEGGPIIYLIGVARPAVESEWRQIQSNLCFGRYANEHRVFNVAEIFLPDERHAEGSAWEQEERFLVWLGEQLATGQVKLADDATEFISARVTVLHEAEGKERSGLGEGVLWPRCNDANTGLDEPLRLRPTFAFWTGLEDLSAKASQADVFMTIAGVLHHMRVKDRAPLVQREHARVVLSPANFTRYNDGVVQASILRAALRSELDYSQDDRLSSQMRDVLMMVFENMTRQVGEAAPEFLLALAEGRLRLTSRHRDEIVSFLEKRSMPSILRGLVWACNLL